MLQSSLASPFTGNPIVARTAKQLALLVLLLFQLQLRVFASARITTGRACNPRAIDAHWNCRR